MLHLLLSVSASRCYNRVAAAVQKSINALLINIPVIVCALFPKLTACVVEV
jgi:hypothetical protein